MLHLSTSANVGGSVPSLTTIVAARGLRSRVSDRQGTWRPSRRGDAAGVFGICSRWMIWGLIDPSSLADCRLVSLVEPCAPQQPMRYDCPSYLGMPRCTCGVGPVFPDTPFTHKHLVIRSQLVDRSLLGNPPILLFPTGSLVTCTETSLLRNGLVIPVGSRGSVST